MDSLRDLFHFLTDVEGMIRWGGYVALAVIVFTETGLMFGFFLPGDSLLVTAGLFAARGTLNIVWLNLLLITMAITGDATGYYIGRKLGPALFHKKSSRLFKREHLIKTQLFYEEHGGKTIVVARFVPIIRTFAPVVAGIAGMEYRRFALFNITGGIGWVVSMTMTGYILGRVIPNIDKYIEIVILVVIGLSILPGFIHGYQERRKKKAATAAYQSSLGETLGKIQQSHLDWSFSTADKIASLFSSPVSEQTLEQTTVKLLENVDLRAHHPDGKLARFELDAAILRDPTTLSEAGYQHAIWEYERRFDEAVAVVKKVFGEPKALTTEPDGTGVLASAEWTLPHSRLIVRNMHEARERPMRVSLLLLPL